MHNAKGIGPMASRVPTFFNNILASLAEPGSIVLPPPLRHIIPFFRNIHLQRL